MGFWDFTPAGGSYRKPVSKKQLKRLKEHFAMADEISAKARQLEALEQENARKEFDDLLDEIV